MQNRSAETRGRAEAGTKPEEQSREKRVAQRQQSRETRAAQRLRGAEAQTRKTKTGRVLCGIRNKKH